VGVKSSFVIHAFLFVYYFTLMKWAGHVASTGEKRGIYRVLVGKPEGKRPSVRPSHKWEDNV